MVFPNSQALDEWVDTALALLPTVNIHEISDRDVELLLRDDASAGLLLWHLHSVCETVVRTLHYIALLHYVEYV